MSRPGEPCDRMHPRLRRRVSTEVKLARSDNESWTPNKATNATGLDWTNQRWREGGGGNSEGGGVGGRVYLGKHYFFFFLLVIIFNIKSY